MSTWSKSLASREESEVLKLVEVQIRTGMTWVVNNRGYANYVDSNKMKWAWTLQ